MMENRWTQHSIKCIIVNFVLNYLITVSKENVLDGSKLFTLAGLRRLSWTENHLKNLMLRQVYPENSSGTFTFPGIYQWYAFCCPIIFEVFCWWCLPLLYHQFYAWCIISQEDLNSLQVWEKNNSMEFHPHKCKVLTITNKTKPLKTSYNIHNVTLE